MDDFEVDGWVKHKFWNRFMFSHDKVDWENSYIICNEVNGESRKVFSQLEPDLEEIVM